MKKQQLSTALVTEAVRSTWRAYDMWVLATRAKVWETQQGDKGTWAASADGRRPFLEGKG